MYLLLFSFYFYLSFLGQAQVFRPNPLTLAYKPNSAQSLNKHCPSARPDQAQYQRHKGLPSTKFVTISPLLHVPHFPKPKHYWPKSHTCLNQVKLIKTHLHLF